MMSKVGGADLAAALVAGTTVVVAGTPAQAAAPPRRCAVGSWRLVKENRKAHGTYKRVRWTQRHTGAAGGKLVLGNGKARYDFNGSKKEFMTGTYGRTRLARWIVASGKLQLNAKVAGDKKGTFATNGKTATGNASGHVVTTRPQRRDLGRYSMASNLRKGYWETLVPGKATFTCSARNLVLTVKEVGRDRNTTWNNLNILTYRRI